MSRASGIVKPARRSLARVSVVGFDRVDAYAVAGCSDRAYLYDSAAADQFYGSSSDSWLLGNGYLNYAVGFERLDACATAGGYDRAYLFDSALDDYLEAVGSRASLQHPASAVSASCFD